MRTKPKQFLISVLITVVLLQSGVPVRAQTATPSPFAATDLIAIAQTLNSAVAGKGDPANTPLALVTNDLSPFWTAGQIGSQRAASELGVPVILNAPVKPGDKAAQERIINTFIADGYKGIAFSAIDPDALIPVIKDGIAKHVNFITFDSDAPDSNRALYLGTNNYNAGVIAGKTLLQTLGDKGGKVVGLVGALTAQNAIDRVRGINAAINGSNVTLITVLVDDLDPLKAERNAEKAIAQYSDLAAFVGLYSYDGPAAGKALKVTNTIGKIKLVAFDVAPDTIAQLKDGTASAAIGQRPYYMGYLSVYILYSMSTLGTDTTLTLLKPYLLGDKKDVLDTGVDIVTAQNLQDYSDYLNSIGISSQ
jgi:ribose transport system substrate-binding protein